MKIVMSAFKPFDANQIKTLKKMGLKTESEPGGKIISGEIEDSLIKEKISKLPFVKYVEPEIKHYPV